MRGRSNAQEREASCRERKWGARKMKDASNFAFSLSLPFLRCTVFVSPKERDGVSPPPLSHTHLPKQRHYARAQVLGATSLLNASECLSFVRVFRVNSRANEGKQREGKAIQIINP